MQNRSHIGVSGGQHRGKAGGFGLAPFPFAGLFKMPVIAHFLECAFAVNLLLQPAQGLVHRLALLKSNFGQIISLPLRFGARAGMARALNAPNDACTPPPCQPPKRRDLHPEKEFLFVPR